MEVLGSLTPCLIPSLDFSVPQSQGDEQSSHQLLEVSTIPAPQQVTQRGKLFLFTNQVGGHSAMLRETVNGTSIVLKPAAGKEVLFYQMAFEQKMPFLQFIPMFCGTVEFSSLPNICSLPANQTSQCWSQELLERQFICGTYLKLEDLTAGMKHPCVMDVKIGRQNKVKVKSKLQAILGSRACGFQITHPVTKKRIFRNKYLGQRFDIEDQFIECLAFFFSDGKSIYKNTLISLIEQLASIAECLRSLKSFRFFSSSLLYGYDAADIPFTEYGETPPPPQSDTIFPKPFVKFIDFANTEILPDDDLPDRFLISAIGKFREMLITVLDYQGSLDLFNEPSAAE